MTRSVLLVSWLAVIWSIGCNGDGQAVDAGMDVDAGSDAGVDAGADDGADPSGDDGGGDGDGEDPWAGCPTASDYQGGGWTAEMQLEATDRATYCFTFDSVIPVEEQIALKTMVRFFPGTYGLPAENGEFELSLPACVRQGRQGEQLSPDGAGTAVQEIQDSYFMMDICQPLRSGAGDSWYLRIVLSGTLPGPIILDDRSLPGDNAWMALVKDGCEGLSPLRYQSCQYDWIESRRMLVRFEGGEITLTMKLPQIDATVFGLFSRAGGVLDGIAFEQQDFWKLAFYSMLHFFYCDFIVLFDEPIGEACGIMIDELLIWGGTDNPERRLDLIDCDLNSIESRTIHSAEELP